MNEREWNSEAYHRLSDPQFGWGLKVLDRVKALDLRGDERVLDAGCGSGRVTAELMRLLPNGEVVGVDLSANMLEQARGDLKPQFGERVSFLNADLLRLPFQEVFDGVFSTAVFHWVKDHASLFTSLYSVLRSGGWLIAQCGGKGNLDRVRSRVRHLQSTPRYAEFFRNWQEPWEYADEPTTAKRLSTAGFVCVKTWLEDATFSLPDRRIYREFIKTVVLRANLQQIAVPEPREEFLDALTDQAEEEDAFALDYRRLNIDAKKP